MDDGLVSNQLLGRAIYWDSSWVLPCNRLQSQRHHSDAIPFVPVRRLCIDPLFLSPRNSLALEIHKNIWCKQAWNLEILRSFSCSTQPALRSNPPPSGIEKLSLKLFSLGCIWEVQRSSSLCSDSYKLQGEFYYWPSYQPPGRAGGGKRREGDEYWISGPTVYLFSCCLSVPSSVISRLKEKSSFVSWHPSLHSLSCAIHGRYMFHALKWQHLPPNPSVIHV